MDSDPRYTIAMLATARYPEGEHRWRGDRLRALEGWPSEDSTYKYLPPPGLQNRARMAKGIGFEDFDGAHVPRSVLDLIEGEQGQGHPLGWVKGDEVFLSAEGFLCPVVYVYRGDFLVAMVAPLKSSPCVQQARRAS